MYTVFKATIAKRSSIVIIEHFDNLNRARLRAMRWGMEDGFVAGINRGQWTEKTLPIITDEAWAEFGMIFSSLR